jgi:hypothetical protein
MERSYRLFARNGEGHRTVAGWREESFEDLHPRGSGSGYDDMTDLLIVGWDQDVRTAASENAKRLRGREKELLEFQFLTALKVTSTDVGGMRRTVEVTSNPCRPFSSSSSAKALRADSTCWGS